MVARQGPLLIMMAFSVGEGLKIFDGGQLVAAAPDDRNPLTDGLTGPDNLLIMQNACGDYGSIGILNAGLGSDRRTGDRLAIEAFMRSAQEASDPVGMRRCEKVRERGAIGGGVGYRLRLFWAVPKGALSVMVRRA